MKRDLVKNIGKAIFCLALISVLIIRYSHLGLTLSHLFGDRIFQIAKIGCPGKTPPAIFLPILTIFSSVLYLIIFHFKKIERFILRLRLSEKAKFTLLVCLLFLILLFGVNAYKVQFRYRDEITESAVFNIIATHGFAAYINDPALLASAKAINASNLQFLDWVRRMHPPLYYAFPALLSNGTVHSIPYYRAIFAASFCLWLLIIILWGMQLNISQVFLYSLTTVPFFFQYLRDQTFIRLGDEFFTFIGFTTFMLVLYLIYNDKIKINIVSLALLFASLFIAFWSKFSMVVAVVALILAMILIIGLFKFSYINRLSALGDEKSFFCKMLLFTSMMFLLVVGLYFLVFSNTFMLRQQLNSYLGLIRRPLTFLPMPLNHLTSPTSIPKSEFFMSAFFRYSPILIIGVIHAFYQFYRQFQLTHKILTFDCLIVVWLVFGLSGVLLVEPSAEYTVPLTFGLVYLVARGLELARNDSLARQYLLAGFLFACTEVALRAFALG